MDVDATQKNAHRGSQDGLDGNATGRSEAAAPVDRQEKEDAEDHETHQFGGAAALAMPVLAGSWPPIIPSKAKAAVPAASAKVAATGAAAGTFAPALGEAGWQLVQPEYAYEGGKLVQRNASQATLTGAPKAQGANAGFEPAGGDAGWQLAQHKYDFTGGKFAMSDECDHAIRIVKAPTPAELEAVRRLQSGG